MLKLLPKGEQQLKNFYLKISLVILIIAVIYLIWIVINIIGVFSLGFDYYWSGPSLDQWILSSIVFFSICIGIVLSFILHNYILKQRPFEEIKAKPLFFKGKKLHIYTQPQGSKGGIFSKTFIKIDDNNILSIRYQMIPPNNLWGNEEQNI